MTAHHLPFSRAEILMHLRRILGSDRFDASQRNRRFLEYVVTETIEGRGERVKAYSIATAVLGRGSDFDPQESAIVRIEAGRLRRSLERYYLTAGQNDPIRISIPLGGYVPAFSRAADHATEASDSADAPPPQAGSPRARRPAIFVNDFEQEGDHPAFHNFRSGFTRAVIAGLTRFSDLEVYGGDHRPGTRGWADHGDLRERFGMDFILTGGIVVSSGQLAVDALLMDARSGRFLWAETFRHQSDPANMLRFRDEIADRVVRALAQPTGAIYSLAAHANEGQPPESWDALDAVIRFHRYSRTFDEQGFEPVRQALERALRADPDDAEACSCLSMMYSNAYRFNYRIETPAASILRQALDLARRAVELSPNSSRSHLALGLAQWFCGQPDIAMEALETSLSLNPNDTEAMAEVGIRLVMLGQSHRATDLLTAAYRRNPLLPDTYRVGWALMHYVNGDYEQAFSEALRAQALRVIPAQIMLAVAAVKTRRTGEAKEAIATLLSIDPRYGDRVIVDLQRRNVPPAVIDILLEGLHDAGLFSAMAEADAGRPATEGNGLRQIV